MISFGNSNTLEYEFLASVVKRIAPGAFASIQLLRPGMPTFTMPAEDRPASGVQPLQRPDAEPLAKLKEAAAAALPADGAAALHRMHAAMAGFRVLGSNSWAIDGRHTDNGMPLIANDPHQPLQSPSVMYAQHLNSADGGGAFDAAGFGFAGAPGVQLGHNRNLHWAATTGFADCMDLFSVGGDDKAVLIGGKSAPITVRSEEIKVKGAPSTVLEVNDVDGYGVLLGDALPFPEALVVDAGRRVLINWTGFRATNEAAAFLGMSRATNLDEWELAVDKMEVGTFNWLAADKDGISYHLHTLIPDRGDPSARPMPYTVVDGDDPAYLWSGQSLPASKLPQSRAEQTGYIVTANNDPFGFTADGDVENDPWYYGAFYDPGYRARGSRSRSRR
jgi:penicillin amidase